MSTNSDDYLRTQLTELERAGFIIPLHNQADLAFTFRHSMIQEAAYISLLKIETRKLHRTVGEAMESLFKDNLEVNAPILASHFSLGEDDEKALKYYRMASDYSLHQLATQEALNHISSALEIVQRHQGDAFDLYFKRGQILDTLGKYERSLQDFQLALAQAQKSGNKTQELEAILYLGNVSSSKDYKQTGIYFQMAMSIAREINDPQYLANCLNRVGNWHANSDQTELAIPMHLEALGIYQELNDEPGKARTLDLLGMTYTLGGEFENALIYLDEAVRIFRILDDLPGLASSLVTLGMLGGYYETRASEMPYLGITKSLERLEEGLELAQRLSWRAGECYANIMLSDVFGSSGNFSKAISCAQSAFDNASEMGHVQWMCASQYSLGMIKKDLLDLKGSIDHLSRSLNLALEINSIHWIRLAVSELSTSYLELRDDYSANALMDKYFSPDIPAKSIGQRRLWCAKAQLELNERRIGKTWEIISKLEASVQYKRSRIHAISILELKGKIYIVEEKWQEAKKEFELLMQLGLKCGFPIIQWKSLIALGNIYNHLGEHNKAVDEFKKASVVINEISSTLDEPVERSAFISRAAEVISVFG